MVLDREERIVAVLVGQPEDPCWGDVANAAAELMQKVEHLGISMDLFTEKSLYHRRGEFLAIPAGVSFGGGQTVWPQPLTDEFGLQALGNLVHTKAMRRLIQ